MASLKQDHAYLYKRVRLKGILFAILGFIFAFVPTELGRSQSNPATLSQIPFEIFGAIYLLIAAALIIGVHRTADNYNFARWVLTIGALYNTFWTITIFSLVLSRYSQGTLWGLTMYAYFTYNSWLVRNDPGWVAIETIKEMTNGSGDFRSS